MTRNAILTSGLVSLMVLAAGCRDNRSNPVAANTPAADPSFSREHERDDRDGETRLRLVAIVGPGEGGIRAARVPHPTTSGNFAVHVVVEIEDAKPYTTYVVQRAPEVFSPPAGPPAGFDQSTMSDGSCQRGLSLTPWSTLAPTPAAFVTFPDQGRGSPIIATDAEGDGGADFVFALPFPLEAFDVMFRVLESSPAPTAALVSSCLTI